MTTLNAMRTTKMMVRESLGSLMRYYGTIDDISGDGSGVASGVDVELGSGVEVMVGSGDASRDGVGLGSTLVSGVGSELVGNSVGDTSGLGLNVTDGTGEPPQVPGFVVRTPLTTDTQYGS